MLREVFFIVDFGKCEYLVFSVVPEQGTAVKIMVARLWFAYDKQKVIVLKNWRFACLSLPHGTKEKIKE